VDVGVVVGGVWGWFGFELIEVGRCVEVFVLLIMVVVVLHSLYNVVRAPAQTMT
jgi:hypothetical protein